MMQLNGRISQFSTTHSKVNVSHNRQLKSKAHMQATFYWYSNPFNTHNSSSSNFNLHLWKHSKPTAYICTEDIHFRVLQTNISACIVLKLMFDMTSTCSKRYSDETNHSRWYSNSNVNQTTLYVTDSLARFKIFILNPDHYVGFSSRCGSADMCTCIEADLSKSSLKPSRISLIYSTIRGRGYMCVKRNSLYNSIWFSVKSKTFHFGHAPFDWVLSFRYKCLHCDNIFNLILV